MNSKERLKQLIGRSPQTSTSRHIIFAVGAVDGRILELYDRVLALERKKGVTCDWVVCVGSLGVWPDARAVDRGTRKNQNESGDFARLYQSDWVAPRPTLFISGAHEDHLWLNRRFKSRNLQVLGNVHHLVNGYQTVIGPSVVGLGKVYSPNVYEGLPSKKWFRHYSQLEVLRAQSHGETDMLITHQGPIGEVFGRKVSNSKGIKSIIHSLRPKIVIHGGYQYSKQYTCLNSQVVSLGRMEILPLKYDKDKGISFI